MMTSGAARCPRPRIDDESHRAGHRRLLRAEIRVRTLVVVRLLRQQHLFAVQADELERDDEVSFARTLAHRTHEMAEVERVAAVGVAIDRDVLVVRPRRVVADPDDGLVERPSARIDSPCVAREAR